MEVSMLFTVAAAAAGDDIGAQPLGPLAYAIIAFVGLVIALGVGYYLVKNLPRLTSHGAGQQAYYVLLVILAITAAGFLFGALRSAASLTGSQFGLAIDLGGPAALFFLVVIGGFYLTKQPSDEFPLTVRLRGSEPQTDIAREAWIVVDLAKRERCEVPALGEITINAVPTRFRNTEVYIALESPRYRIRPPKDQSASLDIGRPFLIPASGIIELDVIRITAAPVMGSPNRENPAIYPDFKTIYEMAPDLGSPLWPPTLVDDAYQAVYENAHVIWIKPLLRIFVLPLDSQKKLKRVSESHWATDPDLFDEKKARAIFNTPDSKLPPHGGIADRWRKDPEQWKWLGWIEWHCRFDRQIYYQHFQRGLVLGIFRLHPIADEGEIILIRDDDTWTTQNVQGKVPPCGKVGPQFRRRANDSV
jgi:hypothetical protein